MTADRTHCDCGTKLPPCPKDGNWGVWRCPDRNCGFRYCHDCGSRISDISGSCIAYEEMQESQQQKEGSSNG